MHPDGSVDTTMTDTSTGHSTSSSSSAPITINHSQQSQQWPDQHAGQQAAETPKEAEKQAGPVVETGVHVPHVNPANGGGSGVDTPRLVPTRAAAKKRPGVKPKADGTLPAHDKV